MLLQLPMQGHQGGSCSSTIAPAALYLILPGECSTWTGWLATWRAQMGGWQPPAAAVEPAAITVTVTNHGVLLCMCIRAIVPFLFPLHWHTYSQQSCKFENHLKSPQRPLPDWWCAPRVINQISDLHFAVFQEMLSRLHAEWRNDGLFSLTVCVDSGLLRGCKFLLRMTSTEEFSKHCHVTYSCLSWLANWTCFCSCSASSCLDYLYCQIQLIALTKGGPLSLCSSTAWLK